MTMSLAILIAILGHLSNAVAALADKFLLKQAFSHPVAYAWWVGVIGMLVLVLLPFDYQLPEGRGEWLLDLFAGATFIVALIFYFTAVGLASISVIVPVVGALTPIATLGLAYLILGERLNPIQYLAIVVLIIGFLLLTTEKVNLPRAAIPPALVAALFFAISSVAMKAVFLEQPFIPGLVFSRLGGLVVSGILLLLPVTRRALRGSAPRFNMKNLSILGADHLFGASGFILLNLAIAKSSPTIINSLQGVQYAFLFLMALPLARSYPRVFGEQVNRRRLLIRLFGILIIALGLALLAV